MPTMQTANCLVKLGGDSGNTVPKYGVTVSEIVVLQKIHGDDAVVDIQPTGTVERSHRAERQRLDYAYGAAQDDGSRRSKVVDLLFPGAAARLYETFEEAEILEDNFAQTGRVAHTAPVSAAEPEAASAPAPAADAAPKANEAVEDDGIGDMTPPAEAESDDNLFK